MSNGGKELARARPAAVSTARAAASSGWSHHEAFQGFLWIAPAFLYLAFFIAYPFFMSLYLSVSSARVGSPESHFVGLQNYTRPSSPRMGSSTPSPTSSSISPGSTARTCGPRSAIPTGPTPGTSCTRAA